MVRASIEVFDQIEHPLCLIRFFPVRRQVIKAIECISKTDQLMRKAKLSMSSLGTHFKYFVLSQDGLLVCLLRSNMLWIISMLADVEKKSYLSALFCQTVRF